MKPIRVLHVVGNMESGGMETLIMNWYRAIDRQKVQFDFLTHTQRPGFYDEEIRSLGGNIYRLSVLDDKNIVRYCSDLRLFFKQHRQYAVVHGHHSFFGPFYLREAYRAGIPARIAHSHIANFSRTFKGIVKYFVTRNYSRHANLLFACSECAGTYMFGKKAAFTVIHNGIDVDRFCFRDDIRAEMRNQLGIAGKNVLVHVGRFHDQKNHSFLIDIFANVYQKDPDAVLLLIGVGPLENTIKAKVKELKLEHCVFFLERRSDVAEILSASDVFVLPSLYEGLPLVLVEAQSAGLCVLCSTNVTEETRLTENYHTLSLKESADKWADEIIHLLHCQADRNSSAETVRNCGYDSKCIALEMQQFYLEKAGQSNEKRMHGS